MLIDKVPKLKKTFLIDKFLSIKFHFIQKHF